MYKVVYMFVDLQDEDHVYEVGDEYPRKGSRPSEERIKELASDKNRIGRPLIEAEKPKEETEKPKTEKPKKAEQK